MTDPSMLLLQHGLDILQNLSTPASSSHLLLQDPSNIQHRVKTLKHTHAKKKKSLSSFQAPLYDLKSKIFLKHNKLLQKKKTADSKRRGIQCMFSVT